VGKSDAGATRPESNGLRNPLTRVIRLLRVFLAGVVPIASLAVGADSPSLLEIRVVEGDGAAYPVGSRATRGVTVLVSDETGRPVEGATVIFSLPSEGPSGVFASGARTEIATTRADGRAAVWGMQWNRIAGPFEIRITAGKGQARAGIVSAQSLQDIAQAKGAGSPRTGGGLGGRIGGSHLGGNHKALWISLAAGGAAGAILAGAAGGKSAGAPAAVVSTTQIGAPTISLNRP
jgi:hypothetical protein